MGRIASMLCYANARIGTSFRVYFGSESDAQRTSSGPGTAKTTRNKGGTDYTRGVSREQRAINRRNRLESSLLSSQSYLPSDHAAYKAYHNFEDNLSAIAVQRFGEPFREGSIVAFEEKSFGGIIKPGQLTYPVSTDYAEDVSSWVVAIALFDGDKMLFACSGIPIPHGRTRQRLTRFVTSAHLVTQFNQNRNKDDKLRVAVRLPDNTATDGFLGLYDKDIAVVTCLDFLEVCPIDLDHKAKPFPGGCLKAAGRAFNSGSLMAMRGSLYQKRPLEPRNTWVSDSQDISKAVLGGPLLGWDNNIVGMSLDIYDSGDANLRYTFLPMDILCKCLKHFQILNPKKDFRGYALPRDVLSVVPSGFMQTICRLKSHGYPIPPPLVLEFNGRLLNHFEECFGELLPWKGFPYGDPPGGSEKCVWNQLPKEVVTDVSRRVVSLASFNGYVRSFACTSLLIKLGSNAKQTVILTSASLVRDCCNEDIIDDSLTIEVFLPPNQRAGGTLEFYNLDYNIAIVSLKKNFNAICPDDIFTESAKNSSKKVIAIGRDAKFGILMAASGEMKCGNRGCKLDCKDVQLSTCKIKKAGIGGPLINLNGSFVGMNFYDGSGVTPFLPRHKIVKVLSQVNSLPSEWWPVPKPYWYHSELQANVHALGKHIGRRLN
ncbi:uncharacterized protein LOC8066487 isoform X4 [Sorghum bicolor]|uniref:uncharacterized protein LOC8066487 isoform X4 n=1 Tax=Sorghum bicolor TaxID=4558 RepID=UPI000B424633|nr:uncharacterized protein LOC8066487 isoform X4 [Sorghum bicolor]|eukprot:XP_021316241.1 uncharacterized protein LOC8066487 isoform X4 [Sorghum bicolor]